MQLPCDPAILLSYINTQLRDSYVDLQDLCGAIDVKEKDLIEALAAGGYQYHPEARRFI